MLQAVQKTFSVPLVGCNGSASCLAGAPAAASDVTISAFIRTGIDQHVWTAAAVPGIRELSVLK